MLGISGVFIGLTFPYGGLAESAITLITATAFLSFITMGVIRIRQNNVAAHREWMLRTVAAGIKEWYSTEDLVELSPIKGIRLTRSIVNDAQIFEPKNI